MYLRKTMPGLRRGVTRARRGTRPGGTRVWAAGFLAVVLLVAAGVAYRIMASEIRTVLNTVVKLPVPLHEIPPRIEGWVGEELEIPAVTKAYMEANFADDFISRRYVNEEKGLWADLYVVYCSSRRGGILGHQPRVCFPAHGWIHDQTVPSEITSVSGRPVKCLVHQFHKPAPVYQQVVVLNFYVLNGQITLSEGDFSGFFGRLPNVSGDPARYVAQVQVSSSLENSARAAAADMVDTILAYLPDRQGRVNAAESIDAPAHPDGAAQEGR
jgi:hypothetical protein